MSSPANRVTEVTRQRVIGNLKELAGPLGPLGSIEGREAHKRKLTAGKPDWLLDGLLDILSNPPSLSEPWSDVELEIVDLLVGFAGRPDLLDRLVPLLEVPSARPALIDALGTIGDRRVVADLARTYETGGLNPDELERLACALGEIGGDEAVAQLHRMRTDADLPASVLDEIDLALDDAADDDPKA